MLKACSTLFIEIFVRVVLTEFIRYYLALEQTVWGLLAYWTAVRKSSAALYDTDEIYIRFFEVLPQFELYNLQQYSNCSKTFVFN